MSAASAVSLKAPRTVLRSGASGSASSRSIAFTDRPEVHSGTDAFAIEYYVWPVATSPIKREADETVILIPLKPADAASRVEIAAGLERLGASALLFLRQIEEVHWKVDGGPSGQYRRESSPLDAAVRRVKLIGQGPAESEVDAEWLVFSRPVTKESGGQAGNVEVAFSLVRDDEAEREVVKRPETAPLVVFFPTVIETHLGFLVQGPYRTTPSRDNVPRSDTWNQHLIRETGFLLVETLRWLRDHELLNMTALRCLPLDSTKFSKGSMFAPLFNSPWCAPG